MSALITKLQQDCGYSETEDCPVDALIDYKDALEDLVGRVDELLSGDDDVNGGDLVEALTALGFGVEPC